ncbi:MAG TPA: ABC transporter permease [Puia sp.]|uniref:ABC transporter permease n=1 Tax=Puia sp. TaxID=2045100 RepID=UPI002CEA4766|nr:ABC transporter permease [Puia sp.]HVU95220.1 ABC transporter permease [Puia sp.]
MFKNYFRTAWRGLLRGKGFSFINISGLVVGMAGAGLILLWLIHEVGFDRFHEKGDRIYQVYAMTDYPGEKRSAIPVVAQPLGPVMQQEFPDVEAVSREEDVAFLLRANGKSVVPRYGIITDSNFLRIFSFPLLYGKPVDQLTSAYSIVITETLAKKLFGVADVVGKTIRVDSVDDFTVTGVLKDPPVNSKYRYCEYWLPWDYMKKSGRVNESWLSNTIYTYALLRRGTDATAFNAKIRNLSRVKSGRSNIWVHFLYPIAKWHLYDEFDNGVPSGGRIDTVRMFGLIAGFILLIACINFMNLSTARSEKRAKEVGIRKVVGAARILLIGQFIAEAFLTVCVAGVLAVGLVELALPAFNALLGESLAMPFGSIGLWISVVGFILFTSLLAGSYPAFYLSSFRPVSIFRKQFRKSQSVFSPRRVLVVLQFCFAIILMICTLIVGSQLRYIESRDTGYNKNNLIYVNFAGDIPKHYGLIRQELLASGVAASVTKTWTPITYGGGHSWGFRWVGMAASDTGTAMTIFSEDADLSKTAGMRIIEGRDIDIYRYPTDSFAVVLNERAVKKMGFGRPIGQVLWTPSGKKWHVVGVVKDYVDAVPWEETPPVVIEGPASDFRAMHIKFAPGITTRQGLAKAETVFKKYNPTYPFEFTFVDQEYAMNFDNNQRTGQMVGLFAGLAIFISCLGLLGLSAFVAESRVKEIGVRKVLGASVAGIARLLSMEFVRLVLISVVIAVPVAWYVMSRWLGGYAYRVSIGWGVFLVAGVMAMVIALATVSFQAIRAARANPVKSLRSE